ncbi:MAG: transposase [Pseudomonadota bacterium]
MARLPRLYIEGCPQHIIQRGNNRQTGFFADEDYAFYLDKLRTAAEKYGVAIHAFVLMTNHVHLLATPREQDSISLMMQSVGRSYVGYINHKYSRTGTLWEGRYKSTLVNQDDYLMVVSRYIELNPVRAGMVEHPAAYPWSSYQFNAMGKDIKLIVPHELYLGLGQRQSTRQARYKALFDGHIPENAIENIRNATNKGWVLGDTRFQQQVEKVTGRAASPRRRGGDRKSEKFWLETLNNLNQNKNQRL